MGASKSKSSSKPVDMTPQAFKDLQQPFADVLQQFLGGISPQEIENISSGYQGPTSAPIGANENTLLQQLMASTSGLGSNGAINGGIPTGATGSQGTGAPSSEANQLLTNTINTGSNPQNLQDFISSLNIGGDQQQSLADFMDQLNGASNTGAYSGDPNNPLMKAYIEAAQRPTLEALQETLSRTLPGRFTLAGQSTQPQGSSAFDRAAAIATRGTSQSLADIATKISYDSLEAARQRESGAFGEELNRRGQKDLQTQSLTSQAQQSQLDRALAASKQQTDNLVAQSGIKSQEVDTLIKNLQAQALPRLIQEQGIERGMETFQNQVNSLLAAMGIAAGTTRPVIGNSSNSSSSSFQGPGINLK